MLLQSKNAVIYGGGGAIGGGVARAFAREGAKVFLAGHTLAKLDQGVILTLSTPGSRMSGQGFLGYGVTCGAIETFSRILAGELGPQASASSACGPMRFPKRWLHRRPRSLQRLRRTGRHHR
jgi:hypothetical protein